MGKKGRKEGSENTLKVRQDDTSSTTPTLGPPGHPPVFQLLVHEEEEEDADSHSQRHSVTSVTALYIHSAEPLLTKAAWKEWW